jgi:hypothetical protein
MDARTPAQGTRMQSYPLEHAHTPIHRHAHVHAHTQSYQAAAAPRRPPAPVPQTTRTAPHRHRRLPLRRGQEKPPAPSHHSPLRAVSTGFWQGPCLQTHEVLSGKPPGPPGAGRPPKSPLPGPPPGHEPRRLLLRAPNPRTLCSPHAPSQGPLPAPHPHPQCPWALHRHRRRQRPPLRARRLAAGPSHPPQAPPRLPLLNRCHRLPLPTRLRRCLPLQSRRPCAPRRARAPRRRSGGGSPRPQTRANPPLRAHGGGGARSSPGPDANSCMRRTLHGCPPDTGTQRQGRAPLTLAWGATGIVVSFLFLFLFLFVVSCMGRGPRSSCARGLVRPWRRPGGGGPQSARHAHAAASLASTTTSHTLRGVPNTHAHATPRHAHTHAPATLGCTHRFLREASPSARIWLARLSVPRYLAR